MLNILKTVVPAAVLTAGLLWASVIPSYGKPGMRQKRGKAAPSAM